MLEIENENISRKKQCELLELNRGTTYYKAIPESVEDVYIK